MRHHCIPDTLLGSTLTQATQTTNICAKSSFTMLQIKPHGEWLLWGINHCHPQA